MRRRISAAPTLPAQFPALKPAEHPLHIAVDYRDGSPFAMLAIAAAV